MAKKLYVGNLNYRTTEDTLRSIFSQFGQAVSVIIVIDRYTGNSKGFGFVEMENDQAAMAAIAGLNSTEVDGRSIRVNEAMEKKHNEGARW